MKNLILIFLLFFAFNSYSVTLKEMPVQNGGRIKPFDTLASESVRLIYGKSNYKEKEPSELVLTWLIAPQIWFETEFIQIKNKKLKEAMGLDQSKDYFSQKTLMSNLSLESLLQNLNVKQKKQVKLNAFDQALQRLNAQVGTLSQFQNGQILRLAPSEESSTWKSLNELNVDEQDLFSKLATLLTEKMTGKVGGKELNEAVTKFVDFNLKDRKDKNKILKKMKVEVFYNSFHPFRYAWISYLFALIFVFVFWLTGKVFFKYTFGSFLFLGFLLHLFGFLLRVYISGRAPVSNMYETVLWVPFGTVIFGWLVSKMNKSILPYVGSAVVALFCLILSDLAPVILDPSIQPLEAVLRSNFWLLTHVLTITISYSAFFLAFILGDFSLFYHLNETKYRNQINSITISIYRSLQIGVLLLAVGTVLGGIWADYSWGRFWGWDPKETWAFIALMGYLALLHARLVGLVKTFGMAAGAVLSFSLVIMAWYGVNFWLGAGLHSYGFGSGGVEYVSVFVALHIIFVIFVGSFKKLKNS